MLLHRHRAIIWCALGWGRLVKFQAEGGCCTHHTAMQFVYAVCLQAMTHSVDNDPTQQAVKLVVVGIGFVEQSWLRLFLGDQFQR